MNNNRLTHRPSKTAEYMALFRAIETTRPVSVRLINDPYARYFLSSPLRLITLLSRISAVRPHILRFINRRGVGAYYSGVARTAYIDEIIRQVTRQGIEQVVILGSGYDTRPYRLPQLQSCIVFEADHPNTLAAKQHILRQHFSTLASDQVIGVACDFQKEALGEKLKIAGFNESRPTLFIWEGVTNYLTQDAVDAMMSYISHGNPGNQLIFTYVDSSVLQDSPDNPEITALRQHLQEVGEPWTFGIAPAILPQYLAQRQFCLIKDMNSLEYRQRYMQSSSYDRTSDYLNGYAFYHVAWAVLKGEHNHAEG